MIQISGYERYLPFLFGFVVMWLGFHWTERNLFMIIIGLMNWITQHIYFPNEGNTEIKDQFMVAPMDEKGSKRDVVLPEGKWKADDDNIYIEGDKSYQLNVPFDRLLYFQKIK